MYLERSLSLAHRALISLLEPLDLDTPNFPFIICSISINLTLQEFWSLIRCLIAVREVGRSDSQRAIAYKVSRCTEDLEIILRIVWNTSVVLLVACVTE